MRHSGKETSLIVLICFLVQQQSALSATTATGRVEVHPVYDHNFNRAVYGNKPIIAPHPTVAPTHSTNLEENRAQPNSQHLSFVGHATQPVRVQKTNEEHEEKTNEHQSSKGQKRAPRSS